MGHLFDLPFSPVKTSGGNAILRPPETRIHYGGRDFERHARGQEEAWRRILEFYERNLD